VANNGLRVFRCQIVQPDLDFECAQLPQRNPAEMIDQVVLDFVGVDLPVCRTPPIDSALTTRPIAGVHWTADTAFVHHNDADHLALPLVTRFTQEIRKSMSGKKHPLQDQVRPIQLELLA